MVFSWLNTIVLLGILYYGPFILLGLFVYVIITIRGSRIHYIEIHEQPWCPQWLRDAVLIQLQGGWIFYGLNKIVGGLSPGETMGEMLSKILFENNIKYESMKMLLDTCSGASGPTHIVHKQLYKKYLKINNNNINDKIPFCTILSDLWPYVDSWKSLSKNSEHLGYIPVPTDASNVLINKELLSFCAKGDRLNDNGLKVLKYAIKSRNNGDRWMRSLFCGYHHLRPTLAQNIIYDTIKNGDGLLIAEKMHQRIFMDLIKWPLLMTIAAPIKWLYNIYHIIYNENNNNIFEIILKILFVTLIQPLLLMLFMHDACISAARTYSLNEVKTMYNNALIQCANDKGFKNGSNEYNKFIKSYEFKYWIQDTLMPSPWNNIVKLTCFSILPLKQIDANIQFN